VVSTDLLERHDPYARHRRLIGTLAELKQEWAGVPMPIEGHPLVIEPTYPRAAELAKIGQQPEPEPAVPPDIRPRSSFWSSHKRSQVLIWSEGGRVRAGLIPGTHHLAQDLHTMGASVAWGIEQESRALQLLAKHLRHHPFKQYLLTGMFIETSPRSGISYLFRRLRPTVAIATNGESLHILAALCLHPIAYYQNSWAGAMCPTDDVIAHLVLMRGDEHMLWRRANQHPAYRPEAGL
jgi:hypothetical protein